MNDALDSGIIDEQRISQLIAMRDRKYWVHTIHPYKVTQLPDGRWQSYFKPKDDKRRLVRAQTEYELYDKLYEMYQQQIKGEDVTLDMLYHEWLEYKKCITGSHNTILRHEQHYNRYFKGTDLFSRNVKEVTRPELTAFCNGVVRDNHMTRHEWTNVKTVLKGMFEFAEDSEYIANNPMARIKITVKFRQVDRKFGETETFNTEELRRLYAYLEAEYDKTHDAALMAVMANTMMGLRVGELASLKWKDVVNISYLHVCREEVRDRASGQCEVVHHTKTGQDRFVVLVPRVIEILDLVRQHSSMTKDDDFIFTRDDERLNTRQINYVLEKYARKTGVKKKSSHKLRKTYASVLQEGGVPMDEISRQLGHSNLQTTMAYVFNPLTQTETYNRISGVFSGQAV